MDLTEILSYKPTATSKRSRDNDDDDNDMPASKSMKGSDDSRGAEGNGLTYEEKLQLLQSIDDHDESVVSDLDVTAIKRMLLTFEKQVLKNQEMRVKFPNQPEKFMESELELNEEIQRLHVISTVPEHYTVLVEVNIIQTLVGLLSHDNSDISIAVTDLIQQLTDADIEGEGPEDDEEQVVKNMELLIDTLLQEQLIPLLVQNMDRLDEKVKEDSDGIHMTLAIIENMCEYRNTEVCKKAGEQGLMAWLLKRVRVRQYDPNKLYASEILAILLQGNETNQRLLGDMEGIDILLQSLAYYKKRDPHSTDEVELMENLFDCLCSSLMYVPNRDKFLKGEGLQLMRLMLQGKKLSRRSALKVLNHAMCNAEGKDNCVKFIEIFGLGSLFPAFMKVPKSSRKSVSLAREHEEHVTSILASLLRNTTNGSGKERIINKFLENGYEKVDRLMELHLQYTQQVQHVDIHEDDDLDEVLLKRLDAGLFTLQQVDYIITELCVYGDPSIKARINSILSIRGESLESVRVTMKEYHQQLLEASPQSTEYREWLDRLDTMTNEI